MKNISKSFPGVMALDNASLELKAGSVHALMGENGAGKSTLMKCLFGVYKPDGGDITLMGRQVSFKSTRDALESGVAMVHQELSQAMRRSVMDNMFLGRYPKMIKGLPFTSEKALYDMTKSVLDELKIDVDPRQRAESLSVSKRQMIEIAKAVSYNAKVIVFDEPTSSLNESEAERLFEIIRELRSRGCGIIYISHKMDEIMKICDRITVMRDGKHISTKDCKDTTARELISLMVGRELTERYPPKSNKIFDVLLKIKNLNSENKRLNNINITLQKGEILGVAGLDGSGRSELLESIFGLRKASADSMEIDGKAHKLSGVRNSIRQGLALVTEERVASGLFSILSVEDNTVISSLKSYGRAGFISKGRMRAATLEKIRELRIKTASERAKIETLSGGNAQKVIIARWLLTNPRIFMLDEPTRGIDVGAKYEIYKLIIKLASEGRGIIMVSSEMGELLGICDRIIVMSGGRIAGELSRDEATQERILELAGRYV